MTTEDNSPEDSTPLRLVSQESADLSPKSKSPQEKERELELRAWEIMSRYEEPSSFLGDLCRSKNFWYAVFGGIFFAFMACLIAWVMRDLQR